MRIVLIIMLMLNLATAKKLALVIGNGDYRQGFLANPTKDADLIGQKLRGVGFTVTVKKNIKSVNKMKESINNFLRKVNEDDIAVVYYAGHGVQCKGTNYLIPTKAMIAKGGQLKSEALNLDFLIGGMSNIKLAVLMIDACRDNAYPSCNRTKKRGLAQPSEAEQGMIISFATGKNQTADDGDEHSPYALALAKFINKRIPIETFFREVGGEVFASSSQRPILKNNFYGRFSFGGNRIDTDTTPFALPVEPEPQIEILENIVYRNRLEEVVVPTLIQPIASNVTSKWITPIKSVCEERSFFIKKGEVDKEGNCKAEWSDAKEICTTSGGRLPTIDELKKVIRDCQGINSTVVYTQNWSNIGYRNKINKLYQSCYKKKGFNSSNYWSLNTDTKNEDNVWFTRFYSAHQFNAPKKHNYYIRCVKIE